MALKLRTVGHATLVIYDDAKDRPLLITDPWLLGSCYWRSWWLERPPSDDDIEWLAKAEYIYLTHEHPDHLHIPSLRRLKQAAPSGALKVLTPQFPKMQMDAYLSELGFDVSQAPPNGWLDLGHDVQIMSLPVLTNDSILLVNTPSAILVNQNDVKPGQRFIHKLGRLTKASGKRVVHLRSHSPAGPAHSYFRDGVRIQAKTDRDYVLSARRHATALGADDFVPFASQAIFRRADSSWANDYRVDQEAMAGLWRGDTRLLPPFVTLDLETFEYSAPPPSPTQPPPSDAAESRIAEQRVRDQSEQLDNADFARLEETLNQERLSMLAILPRGLIFRVGDDSLFYSPKRGRLEKLEASRAPRAAAEIVVPAAAFREAIQYGHVADLFIGMFMDIHLDEDTPHNRINSFYYLMTLRDYGYGGFWKRLVWAFWAWRGLKRGLPPPA